MTYVEIRNNYDSEIAEAQDRVSVDNPIMAVLVEGKEGAQYVANVVAAPSIRAAFKALEVAADIEIKDVR